MKLNVELYGRPGDAVVYLDDAPQPLQECCQWALTPGEHRVKVVKAPAIYCRGWMKRALLYHLSMMTTEFSMQAVLPEADECTLTCVVDLQTDIALRVKVTENRLALTEGNACCTETHMDRHASPEAVKKVKLAYLMPLMVAYVLLGLAFAGAAVWFAVHRRAVFAGMFVVGAVLWSAAIYRRLVCLWHSDGKKSGTAHK